MQPRFGTVDFWKIVLLVGSLVLIIYIRHLDKVSIFENVSWETRGYLYFFFVPVWLWAAGTFFIRRNEKSAKLFAFISGSDNRLSLSRLQAFVWTLVIFGSFAAAMGIHTRISPVTEEQAKAYRNTANTANQLVETRRGSLDKANLDLKDYTQKKEAADKALKEAEAALNASAGSSDEALKKKAKDDFDAKKLDAVKFAELLKAQETTVNDLRAALTDAERKKNSAEILANSLNWVEIPASLLALAGIAIGSGIFSSLISAVNNEEKTACVTGISLFDPGKATKEFDDKGNQTYPPENKTPNSRLLQIRGVDMGKTGKVRFGRGRIYSAYAPVLFWRTDGSEIIVNIPVSDEKFDTLVVDTPNGKLCYEIKETPTGAAGVISPMPVTSPPVTNSPATINLGNSKYYYEFSDLFRDDKNPSSMDLMKFQMFGWTIVAIVVYCYLFLNDLRSDISSLPIVPSSIVILTGLSQAGYLAGKGVSNTPANESSNK